MTIGPITMGCRKCLAPPGDECVWAEGPRDLAITFHAIRDRDAAAARKLLAEPEPSACVRTNDGIFPPETAVEHEQRVEREGDKVAPITINGLRFVCQLWPTSKILRTLYTHRILELLDEPTLENRAAAVTVLEDEIDRRLPPS
jgi:hypothetical protein